MKTKVLLKAAIAGVVLLLALSFVTCELDLLGLNKGNDEDNLDWEFVENANGDMELTVWLDGSKPYKPSTQSRALNLGIARRAHDYFEAVFKDGDTVARAAWEIGQPAGIRGVPRGKHYGLMTQSMICVGKKEGGSEGRATLLGVGYLMKIDGVDITGTSDDEIKGDTRNVTFAVMALKTEVGFVDFDAMVLQDTFITNANPAVATIPTAGVTTNTMAAIAQFKGGATFTIFGLPPFDEKATYANISYPDPLNPGGTANGPGFQVGALYTIGFTGTLPGWLTDICDGIFHWDCGTEPNFQLQERVGIYMAMGQTYDVPEALDTATTVQLAATYTAADNAKFNPAIPVIFSVVKESGGVFAFTFQTPVYALTNALSTNGGPDAAVWYIRPAYGQQMYLLDNGSNVGGAVLMGVGIGAMDWLDIFVTGFGFTNTPITTPTPPTPPTPPEP